MSGECRRRPATTTAAEQIARQCGTANHQPLVLIHLILNIKGALYRFDGIPYGFLDGLHDLLHRGLCAFDGLPYALFQYFELLCYGRTGVPDILTGMVDVL